MEPETLQIKQGDTLSGIAQQRGTTVNALLGANPNITNPDLIIAGQSLKLPSNMNTVQADTLQQAPQGVSVPEAAQVAQPEPFVQSLQTVEPDFFTKQLEQAQSQQNAVEGERTALTDRLEGLLGKLTGRGERAQELTEESGLPQAQRELQDVTKQIAQLRGEFERAINVSEDRLAPTTAIRGEQAAIRRQQAVEIGAMSAMAQALQGNIQLAQQTIDRAIEFEFQPIEQEIQNTMMFLELNNQNFSRAEKRRAESLQNVLIERERVINEQKANKKEILNTMSIAGSFGAPQDILQKIRRAQTPEEALVLAGTYLRDPAAKQALINAKLDTQLRKMKIAEQAEQLRILREYGGLTPEEAAARDEAELARAKEDERDLRDIELKEARVKTILSNPAISSVVGPNMFSRGIARQKGAIATGVKLLTGTGVLGGGIKGEVTGSADDMVNLVEQYLDQQFLDKLIEVKGQGATFGALTDTEGNSIRGAANAIANARIRNDEGKAVGYDMSEAEFRRQFDIILGALEFNKTEIMDRNISQEVEGLLDSAYSVEETQFNPGNW